MMDLQIILDSPKYYSVDEWNDIFTILKPHLSIVGNSRTIQYYNIPCAFDIESTSFFRLSEKVAIMYVWTFSIYGYVFMGRTWGEFIRLINHIVLDLKTCKKLHLIIYVHNLGFDFSFFRKWFEWEKVFSSKNRTPIYAIMSNTGVEFRCSYLLSGYKLETIANNHLRKYHVHKMVGDLDYSLIRHSKTPLTDKEIVYCLNDVKVLTAYIMEKIENENGIQNIPLTKTGYVRRYCRNMCFYENGIPTKDSIKYFNYSKYIRQLKLDLEEYYQLRRAFQGGFVHANPFYVNKTIDNVSSFDFTSSYPAVMLSEKFPVSSSELVKMPISKDDFQYNLNNYCCLFELELYNVLPRVQFDNYISRYRCRELKKPVCANGRVVSAEHLKITVTEHDYRIIERFYTWDDIKIANFRRYKKGYLPKDFIRAILKLYKDKTELKGIEGMEIEYLQSKEMLNSAYGMTVTDIVRDEIDYINNEWEGEGTRKNEEVQTADEIREYAEKEIKKYNRNVNRFMFYAWGVWVTALARKNLFTGILEFGNDYVYSDTDSIKCVNVDKHMAYIEKYNKMIQIKIAEMMNRYKLDIADISPKNKNGESKIIGVWEYEGVYKRFKTLGAKRYMVETDRGINITVSGLNKNIAVPYILEHSANPFDFFCEGMEIPGEYTGKQTHTYIDEPRAGYVVDYLGNAGEYYEKSGIHLSYAPYKLSLIPEFANYIRELTILKGSGY